MRKIILGKGIALALTAAMTVTALAGCSSSEPKETAALTEDAAKSEEAAKPEETDTESVENEGSADKPYEGVTLKYAATDAAAAAKENQELVELVKEKTGINIEFTIVPGTKAGEIDKALVGLMAGDEIDIISRTPAGFQTFYDAGTLSPLGELAANAGYDMEKVFGDGLAVYDDGEVYALPAARDVWTTYYNKQIFDDAGVEYPVAEGWTWEKYIETAQKINDSSKNIYGSFMNDYDNYNYMLALQKGAKPYKEDGMSNFDDPLFKESMKFFYDFGNTLKVQPTSVEYAAGVYPYNAFMTTGQMGMFVCGSWVATTLIDQEKYPRDWKAGILPMPYPEGYEKSSLQICTAYAIPTTSQNKEAAFEAIRVIAEEQYTLGYGRIPARIDLTDEEIMEYIEKDVAPKFATEGITAEEFKAAWFDQDRTMISEKIIGTADATISQIWIEEGQLYGQGAKSLDDAIAAVKERSDTAIAEALEE